MIPYLAEPILELGPVTIRPFPVMAGLAIVTQFQIVMRRAPRFGLDERLVSGLLGWAIFIGLASAHVFEMVAYEPERLMENPLEIFEIWGGLSSFGGMVGGLLGTVWLMRRRQMSRQDSLRFVDCLLFALPFTLALGRLGCGLQHDHPGLASSHWLAVDFPDAPRFDLGLLECFYMTAVALLFFGLTAWRERWPDGFFVGLFFTLYGPVRFSMDALRIGEARYYGWTPGQYLSLVAIAVGLFFLYVAFREHAGPGHSDGVPGGA